MKTWKRAILSAAAAAVAVVALLLFTSALVLAAGAGAVSFMQTFHNAPASLPFPTPCTGVPGSFEVTQNGVLPVTVLTAGPSAGTSWATGTMTDDFVFILMDLTQPSYTGHATARFGDNNTRQNGTAPATVTILGVGSDGSMLDLHDVMHLSVSATGVTVSFDQPLCG
jgi:hypothetical protein